MPLHVHRCEYDIRQELKYTNNLTFRKELIECDKLAFAVYLLGR